MKNSLKETHPFLAAEWHPTKNGKLTPEEVTQGSSMNVWWLYPYDDPKTGKHFDFEWEARVYSRSKGNGCPFLSGQAVWPGFNDLLTLEPKLAAEWHPTKNGDLTPEKVSPGSEEKVWWIYPYDDPATGKRFDFEWEAMVSKRVKGQGCPFLSGHAVWPGFNDLLTQEPKLAAEWHPTKNGNLTPEKVTPGSTTKIWWIYPYDDPATGKHFDFEWKAMVSQRVKGQGCPFLSGHAVWPGFNDLQTLKPKLAAEWHPTKNGDLTPEKVRLGSEIEVWWLYPYDDPKTGKHFDFEWKTAVCNRTGGSGCPFLSSQAVWPGFNDLQTVNPELASEWHPLKNGDLTPEDVAEFSTEMVWWQYPYDDPKTGKHFEFEWEARVYSRSNGSGCPFLSGHAVWPGFNDLQTVNPELASEWHPLKNGDLTPEDVAEFSTEMVWWLYPYDDPKTGKHFDFEWEANVYSRSSGCGCPFLFGRAVWPGFNDLQTVNPALASEWHPLKNGDLTPKDVVEFGTEMVWWLYPYDDPKTGKHFDFEWEARVYSRSQGNGCPFLSGQAVWKGFNDLKTLHPEIAKEWHPTKNGDLTPEKVVPMTNAKVWWMYPYDDPETGKHFDFEWEARISKRVEGHGCPYLSGQAVWKGFNDLRTLHPEIAKEWHPTKNGSITSEDIPAGSRKKYWWLFPYDDPATGKHFDFVWKASVCSRVRGSGCPYLNGKAVFTGFNDLQTQNPLLAEEWDDEKNHGKSPQLVYAFSSSKFWWKCSEGHLWRTSVLRRMKGSTCPFCCLN